MYGSPHARYYKRCTRQRKFINFIKSLAFPLILFTCFLLVSLTGCTYVTVECNQCRLDSRMYISHQPKQPNNFL